MLVNRINSDSEKHTNPQRNKKNEALYQKLLQNKIDHLNPEDRLIFELVPSEIRACI